jgi:hypothetical protein
LPNQRAALTAILAVIGLDDREMPKKEGVDWAIDTLDLRSHLDR